VTAIYELNLILEGGQPLFGERLGRGAVLARVALLI